MEDTRTLKQLCEEALAVQDACNLLGVSKGFAAALSRLRQLDPDLSTRGLNEHPIAVLWASKIASMTGCEYGMTFFEACDEVELLCGKHLLRPGEARLISDAAEASERFGDDACEAAAART